MLYSGTMQNLVTPMLLPILLFAGTAGTAQTVEIATWQGDRDGAVSLTFDDALDGHWIHADPIMKAAGVRGTFFVITGTVDWSGARAAALNGHEIASHSTVDGTLKGDANAGAKLVAAHDTIEAEIGSVIPGYRCHTIAWPYGDRRLDLVNDPAYHDLYVSARNAGNALLAGNSYNRADTTTWWKYGQGTYGLDHFYVVGDALMTSGTSLATFNQQLDLVESEGAWTVFTYHGIETGGYQNISADAFADQVAAVAARMDSTLWAAPNGEVVRYIRQRDDAIATIQSNDGTTLMVSLSDSLDDSVYNVPLTLSFPAPAGWSEVAADQDGEPVPAAVSEGRVIFDAVPDAGPVTINGSGGSTPPVPVLGLALASGGGMELTLETENGVEYEVLQSTDLSSWRPMDPALIITGDGNPVTVGVPAPGDRTFYLVESRS